MHAHRREDLRIRRRHNGRHRTPSREPGNVDAARINAVLLDDCQRHAGEQRRFSPAPALVVVFEPVPTSLRVGVCRLLGVQHVKALRLCEIVHPRTGCEVIRALRTAMQHHDQWQAFVNRAGRCVQLVAAGQRGMGVGAVSKLALVAFVITVARVCPRGRRLRRHHFGLLHLGAADLKNTAVQNDGR